MFCKIRRQTTTVDCAWDRERARDGRRFKCCLYYTLAGAAAAVYAVGFLLPKTRAVSNYTKSKSFTSFIYVVYRCYTSCKYFMEKFLFWCCRCCCFDCSFLFIIFSSSSSSFLHHYYLVPMQQQIISSSEYIPCTQNNFNDERFVPSSSLLRLLLFALAVGVGCGDIFVFVRLFVPSHAYKNSCRVYITIM